MLFPQLIAGPIVRYNEIADQIRDRRNQINTTNFLNGMFRFAVGMAKKLFIADVLADHVDLVFAENLAILTTPDAWFTISAFAFQVYFDFSAYSDIAIGIGLMLGFRIPENFNFPYISRNTSEFWIRWHMTLSTWFRDYIYIPMGGSRHSTFRTYFNLWFIFVLCGAWHGASWTFILWGCYNGIFITLDKLILQKALAKLGSIPSIIFFFCAYLVGLALFRAANISQAIDYVEVMLWPMDLQFHVPESITVFAYMIALLTSFIPIVGIIEKCAPEIYTASSDTAIIVKSVVSFLLLSLCMTEVISAGFNPFIYFRF